MRTILKKLYKGVPFKKQIFTVVKKFWHPSPSVFRHMYFEGVFTVPVDSNSAFKIHHYGYSLENDLFWSGLDAEWDRESFKVWVKLAKRSKVILDIGANTGVYALIAKAVNNISTVYAFEPVERVFTKLKANNDLNGFDIKCVQKALSNANGFADIYDVNEEHEYAASLNKETGFNNYSRASKVETITLDEFIVQNGIKKIDLIKIDVETFEPQVLEGFKEYLKIFKPAMLVEVLTDEIGRQINELAHGLGYLYYEIDERKGLINREKIQRGRSINYLICDNETALYLGLLKER